jgi:hypothetical protein
MSSQTVDPARLEALELLAATAAGDDAITEVIRPAAVLPEVAARAILGELALRDARMTGCWLADPACWRRYDRSWDGPGSGPGSAQLIGTLEVAYGTPTRYEITIFRATVTSYAAERGWSVTSLCDEALGYGGLSLDSCPRADLTPPPPPFRLR